ncbi:homeobox domain-containing protein [Phascolomyces articulosus]|uniref:Homeobox domain-containing protein n=1 Tax=Phascolomyces articulosus TaxID=60185 RepID=A0AAD5K938_9FUNG|nr:homeobox domain-containing protein [Phascolomyces articulosus]
MKHHQQQQQPRKRTRTSPNQLAVLENTFAVNPSPNGRMREQLSRQLAMTERSIQIWFQNRRAKEKNLARRTCIAQNRIWRMQQLAAEAASNACQQHNSKDPQMYYYYYYYYYNQQQTASSSNSNSSNSNPHTMFAHPPPPPPPPPPTQLRAHSMEPGTTLQQTQAQQQIRHQRGATMPILSTATTADEWSPTDVFQSYPVLSQHGFSIDTLEIGTWKRVMLQPNDLQCYCDMVQRNMTWVIQDGSYSFKMTFELDAVQAIQLEPVTNDRIEIQLTLDEKKSNTMAFYMHDPLNGWTQCRDFTQDKQATSEKIHRLSGPALNIWSEWQSLLQSLPESDPFHHKMFITTHNSSSFLSSSLHHHQHSSVPGAPSITTTTATATSLNNTTTNDTITTDSASPDIPDNSENPTIAISINP